MRQLLLLSTTTVYGSGFMDYCIDEVANHFEHTERVLFVPFARPSGISHEEYTELVRNRMAKINKVVIGIHELNDPLKELSDYSAIYIGGGNTFLLLKQLYEHSIIEPIRSRVLSGQMKYMGSSAGTNVACKSMNNTNDMPIVYPPTFDALGLIPFNINPHYLDPDPNSKHKGETRETRIMEFHHQSKIPVLGLREGSWLKVNEDEAHLGGNLQARLFRSGQAPEEMAPGSDLSFLLA